MLMLGAAGTCILVHGTSHGLSRRASHGVSTLTQNWCEQIERQTEVLEGGGCDQQRVCLSASGTESSAQMWDIAAHQPQYHTERNL